MYSYGPPHMTEQKQDDQLEHAYSSSVRIRDAAPKTCQRWWTIGRSGERRSGISMLAARHDDDDDTFLCVSSFLFGLHINKSWVPDSILYDNVTLNLLINITWYVMRKCVECLMTYSIIFFTIFKSPWQEHFWSSFVQSIQLTF